MIFKHNLFNCDRPVPKMIFLFLNYNICDGYSQKNRLIETVLLSAQNIC